MQKTENPKKKPPQLPFKYYGAPVQVYTWAQASLYMISANSFGDASLAVAPLGREGGGGGIPINVEEMKVQLQVHEIIHPQ